MCVTLIAPRRTNHLVCSIGYFQLRHAHEIDKLPTSSACVLCTPGCCDHLPPAQNAQWVLELLDEWHLNATLAAFTLCRVFDAVVRDSVCRSRVSRLHARCQQATCRTPRRRIPHLHPQCTVNARTPVNTDVQCSMYSAVCTVQYVQCSMCSAVCAVQHVQSSMCSPVCAVPE